MPSNMTVHRMPLSVDWLRERCRSSLHLTHPPCDGAPTTSLRRSADVTRSDLRRAAVLIPVVSRPPGMTVLLTKRTERLSAHAGQIAFPGGKIDDTDADVIDAALREAEEEVGLNREKTEVLGLLDRHKTGTGFDIQPVLGVVEDGVEFVPNIREVEEIFEVPLAFVFDETNYSTETILWKGARRTFDTLPYEGRYIWGATAGILRNLCERLCP